MSWQLLLRPAVEAMHDEQLRRHGGAQGPRDENAFESALARPENKLAYGEPDVFELAAAYAYGLARNHAFVDGNKRIAIVSAATFLLLNGYELVTEDRTLYEFTLSLAAGEIDEDGAAAFFRDHAVPVDDEP